MKVRRYRPEDQAELHGITSAAFRDASLHGMLEERYGSLRGTTWAERKCREIDEDIEQEPEGVLVAETDEGEVVGYITTTTDEMSGVGRIPNLAVAPGQQGQGIGRQLINAALDRLEDAGMEIMKIETLATNEAGQSLYPRFGFEEIVRQVHYAMRTEDAKRL